MSARSEGVLLLMEFALNTLYILNFSYSLALLAGMEDIPVPEAHAAKNCFENHSGGPALPVSLRLNLELLIPCLRRSSIEITGMHHLAILCVAKE